MIPSEPVVDCLLVVVFGQGGPEIGIIESASPGPDIPVHSGANEVSQAVQLYGTASGGTCAVSGSLTYRSAPTARGGGGHFSMRALMLRGVHAFRSIPSLARQRVQPINNESSKEL